MDIKDQKQPFSTEVVTEVTYSGDGSKATIPFPHSPPGKPPASVKITPPITITSEGNKHHIQVEGNQVKFIHDRKAYEKQERHSREIADFRREAKKIRVEREKQYPYWREYTEEKLKQAQAKMIPSRGQTIGMINLNTDLVVLLTAQEQKLTALNLSREQFAAALSEIYEAYAVAGAEDRLEEDKIGRFAEKNGYRIYRFGEVGFQACPFGCETVRHFISDYVVIKPETKQAFFLADAHAHFAKHGFFEEPITEPPSKKYADDEFTSMYFGQMFAEAVEISAAAMQLELKIRPFQELGYKFINGPYYIPLQETADFLGLTPNPNSPHNTPEVF